jgi:hypothetical protein
MRSETTPYPVDLPYLQALLDGQASIEIGGSPYALTSTEIGHLTLPSGRVVATDPFMSPRAEPLALGVPPGDYPVTLILGNPPSGGAQVPVAAAVRFRPNRPVAWFLAQTETQDTSLLAEGETYGYAVDSGSGAFMSVESAALFARRAAFLGLPNVFFLIDIARQADLSPAEGRWADIVLDDVSGSNAILFSFGDGFYASFWGCDEGGDVSCLVTEPGLMEDG